MATILNTKLSEYGLNTITIPHLHKSKTVDDWTPPHQSIQRLCNIARHEYAVLGLTRPEVCTNSGGEG